MVDKRRIIDLLPPHLRTDDLRKFFAATIDQAFQPGKAETLTGYIGQYPDYYDDTIDFYITEPTIERYSRQLEPTMVSISDTAIDRVLFYSDLVNHLRANGALDNNHSRMFENDFYSWGPPLDLDKINNFQQYYWFTLNTDDNGDVVEQPILALKSPIAQYTGNGSTSVFAMPAVSGDLEIGDESPAVFVNGISVNYSRSGDNLSISTPGSNAVVEVYRYSNLRTLIEGKASFNIVDFIDSDHPAAQTDLEFLTSGHRVSIEDGITRTVTGTYYVDGVGTSIVLTAYSDDETALDPIYTTIDRRSIDQNGWSKTNRWVHKKAFSWDRSNFQPYQASRPIIEFIPDIELFNYGRQHVADVDKVLTGPANYILGWDTTPWDEERWEQGSVALAQVNGKPIGTVSDDYFNTIQDGDRLLIAATVPGYPQFSHRIVTVETTFDVEGIEVIVLIPEPASNDGDIATLSGTNIEYFFNGTVWGKAQEFSPGEAPLFNLYDVDGVALDDDTIYTDSTFAGNRLFSFALGTGRVDAVLGQPLKYDKNGQIIFENDIASRRYTYDGGTIKGFHFFRQMAPNPANDAFVNDWHFTVDTTRQIATSDGVFSIPANLQANPNNDEVTFITRGQWFDHFNAILTSQDDFEGVAYSTNNWRDTAKVLSKGTRILQHRSPLLKTMLLASDPAFDYMNAARFVEQEYARFRNRFVQKTIEFYNNGQINPVSLDDDGPDTWVELILTSMKANKTSDFAFSLSKVGGGQNFIPPTPASMGLAQATRPATVTDSTFPSPIVFLQGHDGSRTPIFGEILTFEYDDNNDVVLTQDPHGPVTITVDGDELTESDFTQMGRLVRLTASIASGATVIVTVNDVRDQALLALENKIFDAIITEFGPDDEVYLQTDPIFRLEQWVEGKYRENSSENSTYSRSEFNQIMSPMFLRWAQNNQLDFRTNATYDANDPFSWNYRLTMDRNGASVPGHWRGIYRWYFDTDRPHLAPWEMLGFANQPDWWEAEYGAAPYTSENTDMWHDLRDGVIRSGAREGTDTRFARPGLMDVLPVDDIGELLDPVASRIILTQPTEYLASRPWVFGDHGPVENLWRISISYGFSVAKAAFLMKPARWVEFGWDTVNNRIVHQDQLIYNETGNRPSNSSYSVHGEVDDNGSKISRYGIQQWISEHLISKGQSPSILGLAVRGLDARLSHRMAGFTTDENLRIMADNFGLVPEENVQIVLYTSPSIREEFYSGVIVEWTGESWRVIGYDATNPSFSIIPGDPYGPHVTVRLEEGAEELVIVEWRPNVFYQTNILVSYKESTYRALRAHTSSSTFESDYWKAEPGLLRSQTLRVEKYTAALDEIAEVPYGTEFNSIQDVASFLFDYERYLVSRGWVFDEREAESGIVTDWTQSVREFLNWSQVQWAPGHFITLSPGADKIKFVTDHGMVYDLEQSFKGVYGMVDRAGMPINRRDTFVTRMDGELTITVNGSSLYGIRLSVGEIEHALIFSNQTIFDDVIYNPLLDLRQPRLRLIGQRSQDWAGRMDAPGYVLIDNKIKPNFEKSAEDIRTAFEIEGTDNKTLHDYARHLMGYESRNYMTEMVLSDTEQFEFYLGMIKQKGAPDVFNKLLRSTFIGQARDLVFNEEWALKAASYGAIEATQRAAFDLTQSSLNREPQLVRFVETSSSDIIGIKTTDFLEIPAIKSAFFPVRSGLDSKKGDMPTAGYARLTDVNYTLFHIADVQDLYLEKTQALSGTMQDGVDRPGFLLNGERIWVYDYNNEWSILRSSHMSADGEKNRIRRIDVPLDSNALVTSRLYFENAHGLTDSDVGLLMIVDGTTELQGIQTITDVGDDWIDILTVGEDSYVWITQSGDPTPDETANVEDEALAPSVRILRSVRFATEAARDENGGFVPEDELVYVDATSDSNGPLTDGWKVFSKTSDGWTAVRRQPRVMDSSRITSALLYDKSTVQTSSLLNAEPLLLNHISVYDPARGLIPGPADINISFKLEFDPACYNQGYELGENVWGAEQVGLLWWDISAVRFVETETNDPLIIPDTTEVQYRAENWGTIAPGTTIDIYEWTRSLKLPENWNGDGSPYSPDGNYSWTETTEFDPNLNKTIKVYYFWVKGAISAPSMTGRTLPAATVARMVNNPSAFDIPWIASLAPDCFIVSGISQYLNDTSSVMQIEIDNLPNNDGVVHTEWTLIREGDQLPPDHLWDRMVDSVVGMNSRFQSVPDRLLHNTSRQGISIRPRQSLFAGSQHTVDETILAARESLVGMINTILARSERPGWYSGLINLTDTWQLSVDELENKLFWSSSVGTDISLPSSKEYDFEVFSIEERDELVLRDDVAAMIGPIRIFVNRVADAIPQWSVWEYDTGTHEFTIASVYDDLVSTIAERDALRVGDTPLEVGHRVMVSDTGRGFWGLFRHIPEAPSGWETLRLQSYNTTPFISEIDWYADGYSAANPPVVHYATVNEFTIAEADSEKSSFVSIANDGTGRWIWKIPSGSSWETVARENATVALSADFYDDSKLPYGRDGVFDLDAIATRDGGNELRALLHTLRESFFTDDEVNELFFSMVHFAHAHQDQINWAFKTSFMHVSGFNEKLEQTPVQRPDNISAIISYIDEVKPYRVKTRDFSRTLSPPEIDQGTITTTDFDKPRYYDNAMTAYRSLNLSVPGDLAILSTDARYVKWYENYLKTGTDIAEYNSATWNPIRRLTTTLIFDRIDGVTVPNSVSVNDTVTLGSTLLDNGLLLGAASKIEAYYSPTDTMAEKNIAALMNLNFKGPLTDGDKLANQLTVEMEVTGLDMSNANVSANAITLSLNPNVDGRVGLLLNDPDWDDDHPEELVLAGHYDNLSIKVRGYGRPGAPEQEVKFWPRSSLNITSGSATVPFVSIPQSAEAVLVFRDGKRAPTSAYTVDLFARTATVDMAHPDTTPVEQVIVHVFGIGSESQIREMLFYKYSSPDPKTFTITESGALEVVVNGVATSGFTVASSVVTITDSLADNDQVMIIVREEISGEERIQVRTQMFSYSGTRTFTVTNLSSPSNVNTMIVEVDGIRLIPTTEYTISGSTLTIAGGVSMTNGVSYVTVTTFPSSASMSMTTQSFLGNSTGIYPLSSVPVSKEYVWLTKNGVRVSSTEFNLTEDGIFFTAGHETTDDFRATVFAANAASLPHGFIASTVIPTKAIMRPFVDGDWDTGLWDDDEWDNGVGVVTEEVPSGLYSGEYRAINHMDGGWEYSRLSNFRDGALSVALLPTTNASVTPMMISTGVLRDTMFRKPQPDSPSVAWIGNERVEYGLVEWDDGTGAFVLKSMRRGTKGTAIGQVSYRMQHIDGTGSRTVFDLDDASSDQVIVYVFDQDGVSTAKQIDIDYEVVLIGNVARVTFNTAPLASETVMIYENISSHTHPIDTSVITVAEVFYPSNTRL
jgi:hypothetical protein